MRAVSALAVVGLYDELWSGVTVVAAPAVEAFHRVGHAQYALWTFAVPILLASLIEVPIALVSDRMSRRALLAGGLGVLALALACCALAEAPWMLALGLSIAGAASGVACGAAQGELVATYPGGTHRAMARWIAFSAAGDALTPPLIAAALWLFGSYRAALWMLAGLLGVQAVVSIWTRSRVQTCADDDDELPPLRAAVASAARKPALWMWLFAASSCTLLDEVVVALAALRLDQERGWTTEAIGAVLTGLSTGGVIGALACERLLHHVKPERLLIVSTLCCLGCLWLFTISTSWPLAAAALFLLGLCAAPSYPLVQATAFEIVPGQPGLVHALAQLFVVLEVLLPLAAGAVAQRFGLTAALISLSFEPITILVVIAIARSRALREPAL